MGQVQDLIMVFLQCLHLYTGDAIIQPFKLPLLPQELIPRYSKPLMGEMQEDLQHQAVWQARATRHPNILSEQHECCYP
uniref:Uncharacterized protein n=1 Tax=Pygocentrus nattereri TaxID=42514 RepID=A0AAR2JX49_PYGNA